MSFATIADYHANCRKTLTTHDAIMGHNFIGNYYADSAAFSAIEDFALNVNNPIAHRANVIRHQYRNGMGLSGKDAGDHLTDEKLVQEFEDEYGD